MRFIKNLANIITGSRIAGAVFMLFTAPFSLLFFICYTFCGFTDILDGMASRITHSESRAGAALDSLADLIFLLSVSVKTFPILLTAIPAGGIYFCVVIAAIKIASEQADRRCVVLSAVCIFTGKYRAADGRSMSTVSGSGLG